MAEKRKISLVLADVDGTLVTEEKVLTERAQAAVHSLREAGIRFAITSGRPPQGHGHAVRSRSSSIRRSPASTAGSSSSPTSRSSSRRRVPADVARQVDRADPRRTASMSGSIAATTGWSARPMAPHVEHEAWTVKFEPKVVTDVGDELDQVAKIVGVSDDLDRVQRCEADAQAAFGAACHGQPLAALLPRRHQQGREQGRGRGISCRAISACRPRRSPPSATSRTTCRCSSARASASPWAMPPIEVKAQASVVTDSYNDEGFAKAMERFILGS